MKNDEWLSISMSKDLKKRIQKAAAKSGLSVSKYSRIAMTTYMQRNQDWTIKGPVGKKGNT